MSRVLPFGPSQAAEYPDKIYNTCRARAKLIDADLRREQDERGIEKFFIDRRGMRREFETLEAVEDWLDRLEGKGAA